MNIYILGAGASNADGIPLTSEIIDRAFWHFGGKYEGREEFLIGTWGKEDVFAIIKPVLELFDHFYDKKLTKKLEVYYRNGYHPSSFGLSTSEIEGFFSKLYYMNKGLNNYGLKLDRERVSDLWKKANYLFFHTLAYEALGKQEPKYYLTFIEKFLKKKTKHCIVSFNYDLLLESALISKRYLKLAHGKWIYPDELRWTYGINFAKKDNPVPYEFPLEEEANIRYYKLHGSLNWSFYPKDKKITLHTLHADAWIYQRFYQQQQDNFDSYSTNLPLLIPPIPKKDIDIPELLSLWEKAKVCISRGLELHIIGYSIPEVDKEADVLLKEIPIKHLKRIIIANPNKEHIRRFLKYFRNCWDKVEIFNNFEGYLQNYN